MNNLVKIREVSSKYNITARALRYYEDMGILNSTRSEGSRIGCTTKKPFDGSNRFLFYAN